MLASYVSVANAEAKDHKGEIYSLHLPLLHAVRHRGSQMAKASGLPSRLDSSPADVAQLINPLSLVILCVNIASIRVLAQEEQAVPNQVHTAICRRICLNNTNLSSLFVLPQLDVRHFSVLWAGEVRRQVRERAQTMRHDRAEKHDNDRTHQKPMAADDSRANYHAMSEAFSSRTTTAGPSTRTRSQTGP